MNLRGIPGFGIYKLRRTEKGRGIMISMVRYRTVRIFPQLPGGE